jgi:hypothetical protein
MQRLPIFQGFDANTFSMFQTRWASILNPFLTTMNPVSSINGLTGAITIAGGTDISVTDPPNNTLTIAYTGSGSGGVSTLNGLSGSLTLLGSSGITITSSGSDITIDQSANLDGGSADAVYLVSQMIDGGNA